MVPHSAPSEPSSEIEKLIQVEWRHGKAWLNRPRWGTVEDRRIQRCWKLIRTGDDPASDGGDGHRLAEHDIIKFGRSQFRVRQLASKPEAVSLADGPESICRVCETEFEELANKQCRFCLHEGSSLEDPLLAPCQCKGSIQHIHFSCLKHWVRERLGLSNGDVAFVIGGISNSLSCELCKTPFQSSVQIGQRLMPLLDVDSPFIVLESCNDHRLHVLPIVNGNPVKIGRGHECNMNIHDTSISRVQASIEFNNGAFWLKDRGSRFGTYIKITKSLLLEQGQQFSVQVGRTILQLSMKKSTETGDEAPDTDTTASPRGSGRSVAGALEPQEDFLSCEGGC